MPHHSSCGRAALVALSRVRRQGDSPVLPYTWSWALDEEQKKSRRWKDPGGRKSRRGQGSHPKSHQSCWQVTELLLQTSQVSCLLKNFSCSSVEILPLTLLHSHLDCSDDDRDVGWGHGSFIPQGMQPCCPCGGHFTPKVFLCPPAWSAEGTWGFLSGRSCRRCLKVSHVAAIGDLALPKSGPWAGPDPPRTLREKERTTLGGEINLLQPRRTWTGQRVTPEVKCGGSSAARANRKLVSPN